MTPVKQKTKKVDTCSNYSEKLDSVAVVKFTIDTRPKFSVQLLSEVVFCKRKFYDCKFGIQPEKTLREDSSI